MIKGINIQNLNYSNIKVEKLYIKIDKKLILKAKNIKITSKSNKSFNIKQTNKIIKDILQYLSFFQNIDIHNISINKNKINYLVFKNNTFQIDTNDIAINAKITPKDNKTNFNISQLNIKKYNIDLSNIKGDFYSDLLHLYIKLKGNYQDSTFGINAKISSKNIWFDGYINNLNKIPHQNINLLIDKITFHGKNKNINFKIDNLYLKNKITLKANLTGNYNNGNLYLNTKLANIIYKKYHINLYDTQINYDNNKLNITNYKIFLKEYNLTSYNNNIAYQNNNLYFNIQKLTFDYQTLKNITLNHINATFINNILNTQIKSISLNNLIVNNINVTYNKKLLIQFKTNLLLTKQLRNILKVFVDIPVYQTTGKNHADIKLSYDNSFHIDITISTKNSKLFVAPNEYLTIKKGYIHIKDNQLFIKDSIVNYQKSIFNVDYYVKNGLIDFNKAYLKTKGKILDLTLENILNITNYPENIFMDFNTLTLSLKNLKTSMKIADKIYLNINKVSLLKPYCKYLKEYKINNGYIKTTISNKIVIIPHLITSQNIILKNLHQIKNISAKITIDNKINIKNPNINLNIIDTNITGKYHDLDINITRFIDKNSSNNTNISAKIKAKNTYIIYDKYKIYLDNLNLKYFNNESNIIANNKKTQILFNSNNKKFNLIAKHLTDKILKDLNINFIKDADIDVIINKHNHYIDGHVNLNFGYIKDLKAFNNLIAFINLIPSLVTFQPAGFSQKGYKIKSGYIDFIYTNNILHITKAHIQGINLTFDAKGEINLEKNSIKMAVNANILVKLLKDIPILNYILLGDDGGITIKLLVTGDLKNPTIHKNTATNIIESPINIIKRIITTPAHLLEDK